MPNEIYHRSEWGNPKAEGFGDVYFDASATNKLYNHSDYYENSDGTDKILRDIPNKASIVLTPTAYSDGSLNTVIPPYQVLPQEFIDLTQGTAVNPSQWSNITTNSVDFLTGAAGVRYFDVISTQNTLISGKKYALVLEISNYSGTDNLGLSTAGNVSIDARLDANGVHKEVFVSDGGTLRIFGRPTNSATITLSVKEIQEADFDFSRGSSATRVNEQGLIEDVQILSGNLVQNGDFEEIGSELVTNGNFDTDSDWQKETGWSIADGKATKTGVVNSNFAQLNTGVFTSNKTYKITFNVSNSNNGRLLVYIGGDSITIDITNATNGAYTFYAKADGENYLIFRNVNWVGSIDNVSVKEVGQNWEFGTEWSMGDGVATCDGGGFGAMTSNSSNFNNRKLKVRFDVLNYVSGEIRVPPSKRQDGLDVRYSANGSYELIYNSINSAFALNTVNFIGSIDNVSVIEITDDTDIPRIDYTSGQGALLLEPQSTNVQIYSQDFSQSVWNTANTRSVTFVPTSTIDPEGKTNAYRMTSTATDNQVASVTTIVSGTTYAGSIYVKRVSGTGNVLIRDVNNAPTEYSLLPSDGWKRISATAQSNSTNGRLYISLNTVGDSIEIWGAQLEAGSYATSYIPTEGATVTRSADVANNSGNADLFNDSEGVLYAEIAALANDLTYRSISLSDGTGDNRISFFFYSSNRIRAMVVSNGTAAFDEQYEVTSILDYHKVAVKYKANDFALWIDGVERQTDTSGSTPIGLNELIFTIGNQTFPFYGKTKELAVFKEALTDAELESLTSWISFVEMATDLEYTLE